MPDNDNSDQKTELFDYEGQEQFLITSRTRIVSVLNELTKRPDIITAYFNGGKEYLLTAVLAVLPDRGLVVFDYGPDEKINQRLLEKGRMVCVTKHDLISIRFGCEGIKQARYKGDPIFAAPIPESLFRLQRREFFRVNTPVVNPLLCTIPRGEEKTLELPVVDISVGGVGLLDHAAALQVEPMDILHNCTIELPGFGTLETDLEVRNLRMQHQRDGSQIRRIGCAFTALSMDKNVILQRYTQQLQIEQKALSKG